MNRHIVDDVSISDEKPLHMRRIIRTRICIETICFNLRREAAPHATASNGKVEDSGIPVSISDEKPLHMRLFNVSQFPQAMKSFNLRREAAPHATLMRRKALSLFRTRFNLRREAAPHATLQSFRIPSLPTEFQSQTRSRSTCDCSLSARLFRQRFVSISD